MQSLIYILLGLNVLARHAGDLKEWIKISGKHRDEFTGGKNRRYTKTKRTAAEMTQKKNTN